MKKNTLLLGLFLVICKLSFSTTQVRDVLYWNGTTYHVYPFIHVEKRFSEAQKTKLNERVKDHIATSNWRGYYFEFEICRDSLFLVSIKDDHQEDLMAFVLGSNARIMMDDFSDTLYLGYGKSFYDPWFPTMIYESEMTVVFKNGIACWHEDHRNKSKHAELPNNTMKWNECIYSSIRWDALDQNILAEKPKAYVNFSTDSLGKVCDVTLLKSSGYSDFDEEAMRVVASLPEFSAHFVCGKYLNHKYTQPVVFDRSKAPNNERWNYTFSQPRSVIMTLQLKTSEETIPSLFYMLQDSVIYDLGKGSEGIYEECLPAKMVNNDAAFAIQVDDKWRKIATIGQLEEQGVCSNGAITLTLLEIKRILRNDPVDPREYKTPPKPYHRALLSENGLPFTGSNCGSYFYGNVSGQPSNQLHQFILESVCHFVEEHNAFAKQINSDTIRYIWSKGLPDYFPYDSLPCAMFSASEMESNRSQKKEFKNFVKVAEIATTLYNNTIEVLVSVSNIKRLRRKHIQVARTEDFEYYYYEYNCETNNWERVIKCVYSDVITHSFVCLQNDSISIYYKSPNLDKSSYFYGVYRCSNDTLCLSDNLLKGGMKPNEYLFVLDSTHRTLTVTPYYSTTNVAIPKNSTNEKKMVLGRRFKNTSCIKELKKVW